MYSKLKPLLAILSEWIVQDPRPPQVVLTRHCHTCQFQALCKEIDDKANDLSLLDRMTQKLLKRYHEKGIFTIHQLSYLFKPRRGKRPAVKAMPHRLELQALAIRTQKIYVQEAPFLSRKPIEFFLDIEGIPEEGFYYLIGILTCENNVGAYHPF